MTVAQVGTRRRWSVAIIVSGAALTLVSLVAAAGAAFWVLTHGKVLTSPQADPLALEFAPPDYMASWICIAIAAAGAVAVVVGIVGRSRGGLN